MYKIIFISVGHGKSNTGLEDNGASSGGLVERNLNIKIVDRLINLLETSGLETILIGGENDRMSRNEKVEQINNICNNRGYTLDNSLCLEIHINAGQGTGNEILTYVDYTPLKELGTIILDKMSEHTGLRNRGLKNGDGFTMINSTIPASMIIENSFIDTNEDRDILINRIETFSSGIYDGLKEYIGFGEEEIENPELKERLSQIEANSKRIDELNKLNLELAKLD